MKKSTKKLMLSLALVGTVGVGSTLAYLATTGNTVTNSFVAGDGYPNVNNPVYIDETDLSEDAQPGDRTLEGNTYANVSEGGTLTKDPQVHLVANSVESYILVEITGLQANVDKLTPRTDYTDDAPEDGINDNWVKISTNAGLDGVYKYYDTIHGGESTETIFDQLLVSDNLPRDAEGNVDLTNITFKVCAMQAETSTDGINTTTVDFSTENIPNGFTNYSFE